MSDLEYKVMPYFVILDLDLLYYLLKMRQKDCVQTWA